MQVAFWAAFALYLTVGFWLQVRHGYILGDALSRVSAAQSAVDSRDPHLAAIGFIFTPLTAMVEIPGVLLSPFFPAMTDRAFAGSVMSAVFMAGAVVQILSIGLDRGVARGICVTVAALFALNPMIVFYGSNGMSEAPFLFFLIWAVRRLITWVADDDVHHLVTAGFIAMGLAYLTRYDAVAAVAAAGVTVGVITYRRATTGSRTRRALLDLLMVSGPGLASFLGWAVTSWLITGEAFAQFSSQYGNSAIIAQSGGSGSSGPRSALMFAVACVLLLAPTLIPLAAWAGFLRLTTRPRGVLAVPLAVFGAVLAFQTYSYVSGSTFPFLRFYIVAIPMAACLAMLAVDDGVPIPAKRRGKFAPPSTKPATRVGRAWAVAVVVLFAVSVPSAGWAMTQQHYAPQEYALASVIAPNPDGVSTRTRTEQRIAATFSTERHIAQYLDHLGLPEGSVITDTVYGFAVVVASVKPRTFVVPSDPDFVQRLNDPGSFGVRYLLAVPPTGRGVSDALNIRYPTLYETGAGISTLALEVPNNGDGQPNWRIYRVYDPPNSG
jgi:hypothetical protein